jgi:hypothetical protein
MQELLSGARRFAPLNMPDVAGHPSSVPRQSRYTALSMIGPRYAPPGVPGNEPLSRSQRTMCGKIRHRRHKTRIDSGRSLPGNGRGGLITFKKIGPPTYKTARFTLPQDLHRPPLSSECLATTLIMPPSGMDFKIGPGHQHAGQRFEIGPLRLARPSVAVWSANRKLHDFAK